MFDYTTTNLQKVLSLNIVDTGTCTSRVKSFRITVMVAVVINSFNCKLTLLINISSLLFADLLMKNGNLQQFFAFSAVYSHHAILNRQCLRCGPCNLAHSFLTSIDSLIMTVSNVAFRCYGPFQLFKFHFEDVSYASNIS